MNKRTETSRMLVFAIISFITLMIFSWGCKQQSVRFAYLKIDSKRVESFLADTSQLGFIVQNNTTEAQNSVHPFQLVSYTIIQTPSSNEKLIKNYDQLEAETDSISTFTGNVIIGNNVLRKKAILQAVTGDHNNRIPFQYLRLKPYIDETNHLAYYMVAVVKADSLAFLPKQPPSSDPCPPYPCYNLQRSE